MPSRDNRRSDRRTHKGRALDVSIRGDERDYALPLSTQPRKTVEWPCRVRLDQGSEGACVGFGRAHGYACEPRAETTTEDLALFFYNGAKEHDDTKGEGYEGTTPNGLYRFLLQLGLIEAFYRIRTIYELFDALAVGSVDLASPWRDGCFDPDSNGFIHYTGAIRGGHFVEINGIDYEDEFIWIVQSWGRKHGIDGRVKLSFLDTKKMLDDGALVYRVEEKTLAGLISLQSKTKPRKRWWNPLRWFE